MLQPENEYQIPEETVKVAKAAFPNGNIYLTLRDNLGAIFEDVIQRSLSIPWATSGKSRAISPDHYHAIIGGSAGSTSSRGGAQPD